MKRIKKIIVCLVAVLLLCGCFPNSSQAKTTDIEEKPTGTFIEIERGVTYKIVYHRDSKVMYVVLVHIHSLSTQTERRCCMRDRRIYGKVY